MKGGIRYQLQFFSVAMALDVRGSMLDDVGSCFLRSLRHRKRESGWKFRNNDFMVGKCDP